MKPVCLKAISIAEKYYPKKKLQHALRVANYAMEIAAFDKRCENGEDDIIFAIAILHDLVEDTEYTKEQLIKDFGHLIADSVIHLTKLPEEEYGDYIKDIVNSNDFRAFIVKKADMKDHLAQTETLTDKLKEKYFPVIQYFI